MDGYYDENFYFNNPMDYMSGEEGWRFGHMKIVLGMSAWDFCLNSNYQMSEVLRKKGIDQRLDVRGMTGPCGVKCSRIT